MEDLWKGAREKGGPLVFLRTLQKLKVTDPELFQKQDFSEFGESCGQILSLLRK